MYPTTQATYQVVSIFGAHYVAEQHGDAAQRGLSGSNEHSLAVDFDKLLNALRSALSLQRQPRRNRH
jgi:hypothetical protein